jgi:hypothetical protein
LRGRIRDHAIDAHDSERQRYRGEGAEQRHRETPRADRSFDNIIHCADGRDRLLGIDGEHLTWPRTA